MNKKDRGMRMNTMTYEYEVWKYRTLLSARQNKLTPPDDTYLIVCFTKGMSETEAQAGMLPSNSPKIKNNWLR